MMDPNWLEVYDTLPETVWAAIGDLKRLNVSSAIKVREESLLHLRHL